jgi:DNA ligase (NAD+)
MDIDDLVFQLERLNQAYRGGTPLISDAAYDRLVEQLRALAPQHPFLHTVEPEQFVTRVQVRHPLPMLSIEKVYIEKSHDLERLHRFVQSVEKAAHALGVDQPLFKVTVKLDGLAGRDDGKVLASRGNGLVGYDISNAFDKGVVPIGGRGQGLGEIVAVQSYFDAHLADKFEHPRNMVVGIISSDTLNPDAQKALDDGMVHFMPYSQMPCWQGHGATLLQDLTAIGDTLMAKTDYPLDGLVVAVMDAQIKTKLGATDHHYRWQIAVKRKGETAETTVQGVQWQVGRTGHMTPVLEVAPVTLSGATIRRVTAHNATKITDDRIGPGARVEIIRSGEVIPKIERVLTPALEVTTPSHCPRCQHALSWEKKSNGQSSAKKEILFLYCLNPQCPGRVEEQLSHWFKTLGNADWFGIKTIQKLVAAGYDSLEKIYAMTLDGFQTLGFGPVLSENLVAALITSRTKSIEDWRFLAAFGIERLGVGDSRKLLSHFALEAIPGIGADRISTIKGFKGRKSQAMVASLAALRPTFLHMLALGFNLQKTPLLADQSGIQSPIAGNKVVFSGKMQEGSREQMQAQARELGALVQSAVSGTTDILICGSNVGPAKRKKAAELGVKMLSEADYYRLIGR